MQGLDGGPARATLLGTEGCPRPVTPARLLAAGFLTWPAVLVGRPVNRGGSVLRWLSARWPGRPERAGRGGEALAQVRSPISRRPSSRMAGPGWTRCVNPGPMASGRSVEFLTTMSGRSRARTVHSSCTRRSRTRSGGRDGPARGRCGDWPGDDMKPVQRGSEAVPGGGEPVRGCSGNSSGRPSLPSSLMVARGNSPASSHSMT